MKLTKLELSGFKSFAKKTEVHFDKGITAIVGPNGSGKSNIADSIRWVLGEQSAKTLRGSRMEDVIFGGTATRRPMSYCEVTLTFDNTDGLLPIDYSEVSITRRLYRSGESEYYINKVQQRLRDLQELFRDTGLGKEGYSIVGQGKVEEILSNKSGERRKAFEEAAGIMKYRVRKETSERELENTRKNLIRVNDILTELQDRVEPLREQSEKATLFIKLHDELRELEINLFLRQYDKIKDKIININTQTDELTAQIAVSETNRSNIFDRCQKVEEDERLTSNELNSINSELISMTAGLEELIGDLRVIDEKIQGADREYAALVSKINENELRHNELSQRLIGHDNDSQEREELIQSLSQDYDKSSCELSDINKSVDELEQKIEKLKDAMFESQRQLGDAKSNASALLATKASLEKRLSEIDNDSSDIDNEHKQLEQELDDANSDLDAINNEYKRIIEKLSEKLSKSNETVFLRKNAQDELRESERLFENKKSRYAALVEMKKAHDGYYSSIQKLMTDAAKNSDLQSKIEGTVAELISVPQKYEIALEMAMGAALQNIVTPDENSAKYVIEYLRRNRYGRATFLPVTVIRSKTISPDEKRKIISTKGCFGIASELINYNPRYKGIIENLLGRTIIVDSLDTGVAINRLVGQSLRVATLDGDIINPGGSMTGGSTGKSMNILGRERECADLLYEIDSIKKQITSITNNIQEINATDAKLNEEIAQLSSQKHDFDISIAKQNDKIEIISQQLEKIKNKHEYTQLECSRINDNIADITMAIEEADKAQKDIDTSNTINQRDIVEAQKELAALRNDQMKKSDDVTDKKIRIAALKKESDAILKEHERLEKDISFVLKAIESDKNKIEDFNQEQTRLKEQKLNVEALITNKRSSNSELNDSCRKLEEKRNSLLQSLDELRKQKNRADNELDELKTRLHQQEMSLGRSENELSSIQDKIWNDYELTYENAIQYRKEIPLTSSAQRASELRKEIKQIGVVNINSIEEYQAINERYTELSSQYNDLCKAESDLVSLIDDLVKQMEHNFADKFKQICENFKKVFTELFGGGTAELILSDANDILNCDIDILAQIPGKKLQSLAPLSGGERALTAIALQFAILGLKPTAFCLLDEIDASLDEENVMRFSDYIHDYSDKTQFILITHRRGSMLACNSMYGISQEEKGVSKVISTRIADIKDDASGEVK